MNQRHLQNGPACCQKLRPELTAISKFMCKAKRDTKRVSEN